MEITLQGTLKSFKLPDVLTFLNISRKSGTLNLNNNGSEAHIYFENGGVVYASSNQERFRLAAILIHKKKIDNTQWKKLEKIMVERGEKFGKVALEEGVLSEPELRDFLKIQVSEIIYDCFVWMDGTFNFMDILQLPNHAVTISIDLTNLIMEGARRIDELNHFRELLPSRSMVFRVVGTPENQEKISLTLDEWKILFLINGKRTLDAICNESEEDTIHVYRVVYGLYANKLIEPISDEEVFVATLAENEERAREMYPATEQTTRNLEDDTGLLVSPDANLSVKDVLKVTLARLTLKGDQSKVFPLVEQEYMAGRQSNNQIQVQDPGVSNIHARIFRGPEGYVLEDLNSRNGTFVNGTRVVRKVLQEGDVIRLGNLELVYNIVYEVKKVPGIPLHQDRPLN
ncbi:MAG: hypothetical protein C5B54_04690 [Acidobacteria bacterium]|nr:MAG: hypothetical protein C5B54_04690 [Acidobacteriota bacterium]